MRRFWIGPPARHGAALAVLAGVVATGVSGGVATTGLAVGAIGRGSTDEASIMLEATHLPPLLRLRGEGARLTFDAFCIPTSGFDETDGESACEVRGSVFARAGGRGPYAEIALTPADARTPGRLVVDLPETFVTSPSGFAYYAVLRAPNAASLTIPAGGAVAPFVSVALERPVRVSLGRHAFGVTRGPDARVAYAAWGTGPLETGLEPGRRGTPIGASAFDVDRLGGVYLLDEAHHRLLHWSKGARVPSGMPLPVSGTIADMALARDGTFYVLETVGPPGRNPLVRQFDSDGRELEAVETAERTASEIRLGPAGPVVLQQPSNQWMPVVVDGGPADAVAQRQGGRVSRPLASGDEVTVFRRGNEILVALVDAAGARRSWDITSDTDIAEIQLAEPVRDRLVLVARVYAESRDEFLCLLLDAHGVVGRISLDSADWAESAPLGRFRLRASSLYRLGSTVAGAFVDRYDLEVP